VNDALDHGPAVSGDARGENAIQPMPSWPTRSCHWRTRRKCRYSARQARRKADDDSVSHDVRGEDAVKQGGEQAGEPGGSENPNRHHGQDEGETLPENHSQHIESLGSESHANANFAGSLRDRVAQHAIRSKRRKQECDARENSGEQRGRGSGGDEERRGGAGIGGRPIHGRLGGEIRRLRNLDARDDTVPNGNLRGAEAFPECKTDFDGPECLASA